MSETRPAADPAIVQLLKRAEKAEQVRDAMTGIMQEVYRYCMPQRDAWSGYGIGQDRSVFVYDSAPIHATKRFANRLQSTVFPAGQRWAALDIPAWLKAKPSDDADVLARDLETATNILFQLVHASNFDTECNAMAFDIAGDVGCMLVENGRTTQGRASAPLFRCQAVPSAKVAFDMGPWGDVEGVFFTQSMVGRQVERWYPGAVLAPDLAEKIKANPEDEITLKQTTVYEPGTTKWLMRVIEPSSKEVIWKREYRSNPWIIVPWTLVPGQIRGGGPLMDALPDVRTGSKLREIMLMTGSYAVPSFTVVDDGVVNVDTVQVVPGAHIPVRSNGSGPTGPSIKVVDVPGDVQFTDAFLNSVRTDIRQAMFDHPLPPEVQVGLSATEIIERVRMYQQDTGAIGHLKKHGVNKLILRFVDIAEEAGEFPAAAFEGDMSGLFDMLRSNTLEVKITSPIARAQDMADVQSVMSMISGAAGLGDFGARMLMAGVSPDKAGRYVAIRSGVPRELIPTEAETQARVKAEAEAAQNQTMMQSPVAAQVAGAVAGAAANAAAPRPEAE